MSLWCAQLLMDAGADMNAQDMYGDTALIIAAKKGNAIQLDILIKVGANVNVQDKYGNTPLMIVAQNGNAVD